MKERIEQVELEHIKQKKAANPIDSLPFLFARKNFKLAQPEFVS